MSREHYKRKTYEELSALGLPPELAIETIAKRMMSGDLIGDFQSSFRGSGLEFAELREYLPGDDVSRIDWKVTARSTRPQVKLFHEERLLRLFFLVDASASMLPGSPESRFNQVQVFIALLTKLALSTNDQVGLAMFGKGIRDFRPPSNKRSQFHHIMKSLCESPLEESETDLLQSSREFLSRYRHRCTLFVISDFFVEETLEALRRLSHRNDVVAVHVRNRIDADLPAAGLVQLTEAEGREKFVFDTSKESLRELLQSRDREHSVSVRAAARAAGADYVSLSGDVLDSLRRLSAKRRQRLQ